MSIVSLSQKKKRIELSGFSIDSPVIFEFFNNLPAVERDAKLLKALSIGVLALIEDRIASFLSKTSNELGTELESLKMIFEMKQEIFFKSSTKGVEAEQEMVDFLTRFFSEFNLSDEAMLTGNMEGKLPKNKTGDIVTFIEGREDLKIVIECKFDKNIRLGDISTKDIFANKTDTAWSQLIEAQANRDGKVSIIVLDASGVDNSIAKVVENVRYIPEIGFIVIVDSQRGDYSNLATAYVLARDIALNAKPVALDKDVLAILINRIIKNITDILNIKSMVHANIENNKKILAQIEKSLLTMEFSQKFLSKFLSDGTLTKKDLLDFYYGDDVRAQFKLIEKEIKDL
ncbi:hypothetical protein [Paremcibacter congregatus]|uniref:hypothetical protein n=1 Tax=Paremcibacter congregatus TaxID=2043170 RepID=UPI0030EF2B39